MSQITTNRMKIDALTLSKLVLVILIFLTIGLFGLIGILTQVNPARIINANAELIGALNLSFPVIVPSGHPLRHPEFYIDGVDLRFSPIIPIILPHSNRHRLNRIQHQQLER